MTDFTPMQTFCGMPIAISEHAYRYEDIFPDKPRTKRRLRRTRGKFGKTERFVPLAYSTPRGYVMHPRAYADLQRASREYTR